MAKLYWRIKRDGKWTWIAATPENTRCRGGFGFCEYIGPEEYHGPWWDDKVDKPEVYTDDE